MPEPIQAQIDMPSQAEIDRILFAWETQCRRLCDAVRPSLLIEAARIAALAAARH
jgi:hypothetical protein